MLPNEIKTANSGCFWKPNKLMERGEVQLYALLNLCTKSKHFNVNLKIAFFSYCKFISLDYFSVVGLN